MAKKQENHRREERLDAVMPVRVEDAAGLTRDISASGMFLETDASYAIGSPISLALDLVMPWGKAVFRCTGKVVRLERRKNQVGMAVEFTDIPFDIKPKVKSARVRHRRAAAARK